MSDEIKKIAALIGHQQAQEKRVAALIEEFQAESAKLSRQTAQLAQVIHELDSASGKRGLKPNGAETYAKKLTI